MLNRMYELSRQAVTDGHQPDLLIWPETMLGPLGQESTADDGQFVAETQAVLNSLTYHLNLGAAKPVSLLVGAEVVRKRGGDEEDCDDCNSALLLAPSGQALGRYDKVHAVIFGEYMTLGGYFPWLYQLSPLREGLCEGKRPEAFDLGGLRFCPSICYESILPHEVRGAVARLRAEGREPDVLVNHTNSGWFWGSSELDLHLACNVLRAVECRKPMLVAANTGISAWIDDAGAIRDQGPRRAEGIVYATVGPSRAASVYTYVGDWPAALCLIACGLAVLVGLQGRWSARRG